MRTDDLVAMLANGADAVPPNATARRLQLALLAGAPVSLAILFSGYGVRDDMAFAMSLPMFWVKLLLPLSIAVSAFVAAQRLARPGIAVRHAWMGVVGPVLLLWAMGALAWLGTPMEARLTSVLGQTWRTCVFNIGLLSLPIFVTTLMALKELAPTRQTLAGAAAGALAGSIGAAVYALHCVELAAPFLAVWYVMGMAGPVLAGAILGRWLLRW